MILKFKLNPTPPLPPSAHPTLNWAGSALVLWAAPYALIFSRPATQSPFSLAPSPRPNLFSPWGLTGLTHLGLSPHNAMSFSPSSATPLTFATVIFDLNIGALSGLRPDGVLVNMTSLGEYTTWVAPGRDSSVN
ncbi:Uncharacterized protein Fot_10019 [Forsythia ovata]|uniref:Uncharacterized protein n=1 Tax=Forsythia ovata TaxID=205694 RepID=A0ABD1WFN4_9LAMI